MDLQIDDFYKDVAVALLTLYQAFPRRVPLYVEDLIGHEPADEFGLPSKRHQSCLGALLWLADEGYLRYETRIHYEAIDQAILSEKSLIQLTRLVSPSASPGATAGVRRMEDGFAQRMRRAVQSGDSEHIAEVVRQFFVTSCADAART